MKTIAFFNNKGGVGKTTLAYHIAWMLTEQGFTVLAADLDPQANLTSMFLDEETLENLWIRDNNHNEAQTVFEAIEQLKRGLGDVREIVPRAIEQNERLFLVPGDLTLSDFESDLAEQWPKCLDRDERAFRVTSAFSRIVRQAAEAIHADVAVIDVGPNLGAINRTALIASDCVVIPLGPDIFSLQGLRNVGPRLRDWRRDWEERTKKNPARDLRLPTGTMQPVGYVMMRHAVRLDRPARWFGKWIARMPEAYLRHVLDDQDTSPSLILRRRFPGRCPFPMRRAIPSGRTTRCPSGLNAAEFTARAWPRRTLISRPLLTSHSRAVLSVEAVTTSCPSGLNAAELVDPRSLPERFGRNAAQLVGRRSRRVSASANRPCTTG